MFIGVGVRILDSPLLHTLKKCVILPVGYWTKKNVLKNKIIYLLFISSFFIILKIINLFSKKELFTIHLIVVVVVGRGRPSGLSYQPLWDHRTYRPLWDHRPSGLCCRMPITVSSSELHRKWVGVLYRSCITIMFPWAYILVGRNITLYMQGSGFEHQILHLFILKGEFLATKLLYQKNVSLLYKKISSIT